MPVSEDKKAIRKSVLERRSVLTAEEHANKSAKIQKHSLGLDQFQTAKTIMLFLNFKDEVETTALAEKILEMGKSLVVPLSEPQGVLIPAKIHDLQKDLEPGVWGIREPKRASLQIADPTAIDLVFMPGVAFDTKGNRLGYGGGYYDRFLERLRGNTPKIALAFSCQIVDDIPLNPYDKKIDALITEEGIKWF